jgi:hypothetical protein
MAVLPQAAVGGLSSFPSNKSTYSRLKPPRIRDDKFSSNQAGRQLMFREIFEAGHRFLTSKDFLFALFDSAPSISFSIRVVRLAA